MPNHIHMIVFVGERSIRESTLRKRSIISNAMLVLSDKHKKNHDEFHRGFYHPYEKLPFYFAFTFELSQRLLYKLNNELIIEKHSAKNIMIL